MKGEKKNLPVYVWTRPKNTNTIYNKSPTYPENTATKQKQPTV